MEAFKKILIAIAGGIIRVAAGWFCIECGVLGVNHFKAIVEVTGWASIGHFFLGIVMVCASIGYIVGAGFADEICYRVPFMRWIGRNR